MQPVFNTVAAIFGQRGTGKTQYLKGNKELNLPGFFSSYLNKGMKILIIDTIDHPAYKEVPIIRIEQLKSWKKGVYRIFLRPSEIPQLINLLNTLPSAYNTLIVCEDAYKYIKDKFFEGLEEFIINSKQKNIDIIFMYHCWAWAPKDLFRVLDLIEVFKTKDSPAARKDSMPGYFEDAMKVYNEVNKNRSLFYHKLLNTGL